MTYSLSNFKVSFTVSLSTIHYCCIFQIPELFCFLSGNSYVWPTFLPIALTPPPSLHSPTPPFYSVSMSLGPCANEIV